MDWTTALDNLVGAWLSGSPDRKTVDGIVAKWIAGDRTDLASVIQSVLDDGTVSQADILKALGSFASSFEKGPILGSDLVKGLIQDLTTGSITSKDVGVLAGNWLASRVGDANLQQLIKSAAAGTLSTNSVEQAIFKWLSGQGKAQLVTDLKSLLAGPSNVSVTDLVTLAATYLVHGGQIANAGTNIDQEVQALTKALGALGDSPLITILSDIASKDYVSAIKSALSDLGITADEALIQAVVSGNLQAIAEEYLRQQLVKSLGGLTDSQRASLADALIKILSGQVSLIASTSEQQDLGMTDAGFAIWLRVRRVLYAAQLGVSGGPLVSTDAMAQPLFLAAAAIQFDTAVNTLAKQPDWPLLLSCIKLFTSQEFQQPMGTPINMDDLKFTGNDTRKASFVFNYVVDILNP